MASLDASKLDVTTASYIIAPLLAYILECIQQNKYEQSKALRYIYQGPSGPI